MIKNDQHTKRPLRLKHKQHSASVRFQINMCKTRASPPDFKFYPCLQNSTLTLQETMERMYDLKLYSKLNPYPTVNYTALFWTSSSSLTPPPPPQLLKIPKVRAKHDAIYLTYSFVVTLAHCVNFKTMTCESTSFNRRHDYVKDGGPGEVRLLCNFTMSLCALQLEQTLISLPFQIMLP